MSQIISNTLQKLEASRRPDQSVICTVCPGAIWYATKTDVTCMCMIMRLKSWSTKEPTNITECDGLIKAQEAEVAAAEKAMKD